MSGGWQVTNECDAYTSIAAVTGSSTGTAVTASASTNTKGSWAQLIASTIADATEIHLQIVTNSAANSGTTWGLDIGIGAAGVEQVIVSNILVQAPAPNGVQNFSIAVRVPVSIPTSTRVAARCQASTTSAPLAVQAQIADSSLESPQEGNIGEAIGFVSGTTLGTLIDPGATPNTKGAYTQLIASTTADYMGFFLATDMQNVGASALNTKLVDVAIGSGGSEQIVVPNLLLALNNTTGNVPAITGPFMIPIPSGSRIAARAECSSGTTNDRKFGLELLGIR